MKQINIYDLLGDASEAARQRLHQTLEELDVYLREQDETETYSDEHPPVQASDEEVVAENTSPVLGPDLSDSAIKRAIRSTIMNTLTKNTVSKSDVESLYTLMSMDKEYAW